MRCVAEASLHKENSFLTLTYNDEHLPEKGTLHKPHLQKFFKRLRFSLGSKTVRYYACGEYGDNTQRAHYHVCLFGHDFADKIEFRQVGEHKLYISQQLNDLWTHGQTSIGALTFETAAYTARYVTKKQTGLKKGGKGYVSVDDETGEIIQLQQPYAAMSLKPAVGREWIEKYASDIYNNDKDFLHLRGRKMRPAKYYDKIYDSINPEHMAMIKMKREQNSKNLTENELRACATIARARMISRKQI